MEGKHTALVTSDAGESTQELRLYRWLDHNRLSDLTVSDRFIRKKARNKKEHSFTPCNLTGR